MSRSDVESRAAELRATPAGCAFLLAVEESGIPAREAAEPPLRLR